MFIKSTINNPTTEITVSRVVQTWNVCLTLRSKYSENIQKPASFTWEAAKEPAPMAKAIMTGSAPSECINGIIS